MAKTTMTTKRQHCYAEWDWNIHDLTAQLNFYATHGSGFGELFSDPIIVGVGTRGHSKWGIILKATPYGLHRSEFEICLWFQGWQNRPLGQSRTDTVNVQYEFKVDGVPETTAIHFRKGGSATLRLTIKEDGEHQYSFPESASVTQVYYLDLEYLLNNVETLIPDNTLKLQVKLMILMDDKPTFEMSVLALGLGHDPDLQLPPPRTAEPLETFYGKFLDNSDLSDVIIRCGQTKIFAHKFVLSAQSLVFRKMLETPMKESLDKEIRIEDVEPKTVKKMLEFVYTGKVDIPQDLPDLLSLLDCAEKWHLSGLKDDCFHKLCTSINDERAVHCVMAAQKYNASPNYTKYFQDYCLKRHATLMQNREYAKYYCENPQDFLNKV